jgi:hypothetical protein
MKSIIICSLLLINFYQPSSPASVTIEGVVVGKDSNRPVPQAYLFVIKGEEETITAGNGKFAITTWQKFPLSLSVEHPDFKKIKLVIKEPGAKQLIRLEAK